MSLYKTVSKAALTVTLPICISFSVCVGKAYAFDRSSKMTNNSIGHLFSESQVDSPSIYFLNRNKALDLVRSENWQAAKPILESLTSQYPDDGDTWYIFGLTYFQLGEWQNAINAYEKTLALGTILSGIPKASAPSNDIMINIAEAYAELGQEANALHWINKALEARYDEKHSLAKNKHFSKIADSIAFQRVVGSYVPNQLSREQAWQFDLNYLVSEITRLHVNQFHSVTEIQFNEMVADIDRKIPTLSDKEIIFKFMKLVSSLGNGHNFIIPTFNEKGAFNQLPVQFYKFSDGLFIVGADEAYQELIGHKVIAIGEVSAEEALMRVKAVNARDNEMQQLWLGPHYLSLPEVLSGLEIINDPSTVSLVLDDNEGKRKVVTPSIRAMKFNGFPKLPALASSDSFHNLQADKQYWYKFLPSKSALYIQYNYVHNNRALTFEDFNKELREQISDKKVQHLILDIRHNAGGDGSTYPPLLKTLAQFEALKPHGKLFVIMGRNTFSAAHNLLLDIDRITDAILVGEPSGSRPNALSEAGWFKLPYSKTLGIVSSQYHQPSKAEDHRIWVAPHVPISLSSFDYFSGKDPALEAIFKIANL